MKNYWNNFWTFKLFEKSRNKKSISIYRAKFRFDDIFDGYNNKHFNCYVIFSNIKGIIRLIMVTDENYNVILCMERIAERSIFGMMYWYKLHENFNNEKIYIIYKNNDSFAIISNLEKIENDNLNFIDPF